MGRFRNIAKQIAQQESRVLPTAKFLAMFSDKNTGTYAFAGTYISIHELSHMCASVSSVTSFTNDLHAYRGFGWLRCTNFVGLVFTYGMGRHYRLQEVRAHMLLVSSWQSVITHSHTYMLNTACIYAATPQLVFLVFKYVHLNPPTGICTSRWLTGFCLFSNLSTHNYKVTSRTRCVLRLQKRERYNNASICTHDSFWSVMDKNRTLQLETETQLRTRTQTRPLTSSKQTPSRTSTMISGPILTQRAPKQVAVFSREQSRDSPSKCVRYADADANTDMPTLILIPILMLILIKAN